MPKAPPVMTHLDVDRLKRLVEAHDGLSEVDRLDHELRRATVIPAHSAPCDLVTMNSTVVYEDELGAEPKEVTLVYPWHACARGAVSVLSALGTSLLGMRVGRSSGGVRRVVAVAYQPEAVGDWHL